ncbi:sodium:solute symporter [candidate division KSB1 bacterium]|nr:sodium:solute symporter [candidate division KSB1 bacterium]
MSEYTGAVQFTGLDFFWGIAYILLTILSGVFFYKLGKRSGADFFLAGRGLPWWLPATSNFATHTATDTPMWFSGFVYKHGMFGVWQSLFAGWCAISAWVSTRIFRRSLAGTQAEWQTLRFSGLPAEMMRGWMAGWQVALNMFIAGWVGIAMGNVCQWALGWPLWYGLVFFSTACAIYAMTSGFWGVIIADVQQGITMLITIVLVSIWAVMAVGSPQVIVDKIHALGRPEMLNPFHFTGWVSGDYPLMWLITMIAVPFLGGFGMATHFDWFVEAQRIQSAKTVKAASYSIWWGAAAVIVRNSIWVIAVLAFFVLHPDIQDESAYQLAWFRMGFEYFPAGLVGFFFAAILAIHFSTISGILNLGAMYATRDLYHHYINPRATEKKVIWVGRLMTVLVLLGSFFFGIMIGKDVTKWLFFALWLMVAGTWLPNILQVVWWRFNGWGYLSAWVANLGICWLVVWILPAFGILPELPQFYQFWILMAAVALIYIPVTFLTKPDDMDRLVKLYVQTRPIGFWGPVKKEAENRGLLQVLHKIELKAEKNAGKE